MALRLVRPQCSNSSQLPVCGHSVKASHRSSAPHRAQQSPTPPLNGVMVRYGLPVSAVLGECGTTPQRGAVRIAMSRGLICRATADRYQSGPGEA